MSELNEFDLFVNRYDDFALESSFDNIKENHVYKESEFTQVYVVLFKGNHLGAKLITITGDYFYHTAISFDTKMDHCYTFSMGGHVKGQTKVGNKFYNFGNRSGGFTIQDIQSKEFRDQTGQIMAVFITNSEKQKLKERLRYFLENARDMKYNVPNFLKILVKAPDKNPNARICSSFVADIINSGDSQRSKYESSRNRPQELQSAVDCFSVWSGVFSSYSEKTLIRNTQNWKKKYVAILNEK